jgi:hypothetical protein
MPSPLPSPSAAQPGLLIASRHRTASLSDDEFTNPGAAPRSLPSTSTPNTNSSLISHHHHHHVVAAPSAVTSQSRGGGGGAGTSSMTVAAISASGHTPIAATVVESILSAASRQPLVTTPQQYHPQHHVSQVTPPISGGLTVRYPHTTRSDHIVQQYGSSITGSNSVSTHPHESSSSSPSPLSTAMMASLSNRAPLSLSTDGMLCMNSRHEGGLRQPIVYDMICAVVIIK